MPAADLLLAGARVLTLDAAGPQAEAVAVRAGRIVAVGAWADLRALVGPATEVVDAAGGVAIPAFHDAHLHLLAYARTRRRLDCRAAQSIADLTAALAIRARTLPPGAWVRGWGYDDARLRDGRHPDRHDLDAAVPHHPVRLQHRSLHLDVLNTPALHHLDLWHDPAPAVERDPATGAPTGRLYHAAALLRVRRAAHPAPNPATSEAELAADVRAASDRLLASGITTVQDATYTNGPAERALFTRLATTGDLRVRLFLMSGWPPGGPPQNRGLEVGAPPSSSPQDWGAGRGLLKLMLDEATSDPAAVRGQVAAAHAAGYAVALHAVSEAEVAIALDALRAAQQAAPPDRRPRLPDRIEHGAVIPDAWLPDLRALGVTVVGQPTLVYERGDVYRAAYPPALHGWLHRAASLLRAGVAYAAGSDAPVAELNPAIGLYAARHRQARDGSVLGPGEALDPHSALAAFTLGPAQAIGAAHWLGRLRPGLVADVAVLDPDTLTAPAPPDATRPARLTILAGRIVWRAP